MLIYFSFIDSDEDKSFFEEIFYKYRKQMVYYAFTFVNNDVDAEDIVHDVFLSIAQRYINVLKKIENDADIRNYLLKATKNTALNQLRTKNKATNINFDIKDDVPDVDFLDRICSNIEYEKIVSAIMSMDEIYQSVLYYHFVMDLSVKDVSALLNRSVSTTKKQLVRGKKMLLDRLEKEGKQ